MLVIHGSDGVIRAFHNVCSHRGNKLVWEERGQCGGYLSCCFHGWTYDLEGKLRGVLDEDNFHEIARERLGLSPLATDTWKGFIFVHFQHEPEETLEEYLGGMTEEFADHDLGALHLTFRYDVEERANWKVAIDAQNEIYHLPILGPVHGAFTDILETNEEGCTRFSHFKRFGRHTLWATGGNPDYVPAGVEQLIGAVPITPLELPTNSLFDFYVLFPNMVIAFLPGGMMFTYNFWPQAVDRTVLGDPLPLPEANGRGRTRRPALPQDAAARRAGGGHRRPPERLRGARVAREVRVLPAGRGGADPQLPRQLARAHGRRGRRQRAVVAACFRPASTISRPSWTGRSRATRTASRSG